MSSAEVSVIHNNDANQPMLTCIKDLEKLQTASKEHEPDHGEIIPYVLFQQDLSRRHY